MVCCALRLARFNITTHTEEAAWKENFFEGVPSPAGAGLALLPLVFSMSEIYYFENYKLLISSIILPLISILMISKIPTYSLKKITIPRSTTIFLLFGVCLYFGMVIIYTFKVLFISGIVYLAFIPISFIHYKKLKNKNEASKQNDEIEEIEDVL